MTLRPGAIPAAHTATFSPACAAGLSCLKSPWNQAEKRSNLRVVCVRACVYVLGRGGSGGVQGPAPTPTAITHSHPRPGRESCSLVVGALSPAGPQEFGPERTFSGILGPRRRGAERRPRTLLSPGSGRSGFSEPPASLGVRLPLLPREAHRRSKAAFGLGPRSVNRTAPAAICSGGGDSEIFPPSSQHQPHACGAFSRVARKAGPATSGTPLRPPPGEDFIEEDSGSAPPTRRGRPPAPPSRLPASRSGRCSPAPTLIRLREAGLGLAGPGLSRTPADGDACHLQALGHGHTHTHTHTRDRRTSEPSRRWCGPGPGDSSAHACDVKARPLFTPHQHQPQAPGHSDPHASPSLASHLPPRQQGPTWAGRA